jgi:hypothetical protein
MTGQRRENCFKKRTTDEQTPEVQLPWTSLEGTKYFESLKKQSKLKQGIIDLWKILLNIW